MSALVTSVDAFLGGKLTIEQPKSGYRAGLDAVFLAASVIWPREQRPFCVLDVGAGVGTVGLCVARRCLDAQVTLLEREPQLAGLARENIKRNALAERVRVIETALDASAADLSACGLSADSFDDVVANPPYHSQGQGTPAPNAMKAASHAMEETGLDAWVRFMARMAKPGGRVAMVHKAEALPAVLAAFQGRFGDMRVLPLYPRAGEPASRIIVQATKGSRAQMVLLPGFTLHGEGNVFAGPSQHVLRDGAGVLMMTLAEVMQIKGSL